MTRDRLRLAVPNKGRLLEPTGALLRDAGLIFDDQARALVSHAQNVALDILSVRTEDVVEFVGHGAADLGVTGANLLAEAGAELPVLLELGYGRCALEAAVPVGLTAMTLEDLAGMRLATTHPNLTRRTFAERGIAIEVVQVSGAVEVAPRMGLADGIVDLVSSGSTLVMNGLRSVGRLMASQALLIGAPPSVKADPRLDEIVTMIGAVVAGRGRKYVMMNAPTAALEAIEAILPGLDSPSIMPLAHHGMAAVHAVVGADEVWGLLGRLRGAGATGILVVPIEKLVP
jgi:ATP phosphoribosyltransferase